MTPPHSKSNRRWIIPLPPGLNRFDPVVLLTTWFHAGRFAKAPGTWGSLAALPCALIIHALAGSWGLLVAALICFGAGVWATGEYARISGRKDPSEAVIDEVAAQWLVLAFAPFALLPWLASFAFFRLFDIWKPWPVGVADRALTGGFGIMADDILAAIYAILTLAIIRFILGL